MQTLAQQLESYGAYHRHPLNKLTHWFGVPLVTFALLLAMSWLRLWRHPELPVTAATLFYAIVMIYYLRLDWKIALLQLPFTLALLVAADRIALWDWPLSLWIWLGALGLGVVFQLVGHAIEGRRPAFVDNLVQIFNAPLFLAAEAAQCCGWQPAQRSQA